MDGRATTNALAVACGAMLIDVSRTTMSDFQKIGERVTSLNDLTRGAELSPAVRQTRSAAVVRYGETMKPDRPILAINR